MDRDGFSNPEDAVIRSILETSRNVAVVGLSDKSSRPSYQVARYLQNQGYRIVPVNPRLRQVLGETAYATLLEVPGEVDLVDVFRRPEQVDEVADQAVARGARVLWLQEGVVNQPAAERARKAGMVVVMDRCLFKEHRRLLGDQE